MQRSRVPLHHQWYPQVEDLCPQVFTLPRWPSCLFSENCLITWILSNTIRLPVFSGQTLHSTGGISPCTFHLFLMAGPSGRGPCGYLASAISSDIAPSSSEGSQDCESKHLKVKATISLSTFLCVESANVRAQNILCGHDSSKASRDKTVSNLRLKLWSMHSPCGSVHKWYIHISSEHSHLFY